MSLIDRIHANGGEVTRDKWRVTLRPGRLKPDALAWLRDHRDDLLREVWPEYDDWQERAAIMEFDAGLARPAAEEAAYSIIMNEDQSNA